MRPSRKPTIAAIWPTASGTSARDQLPSRKTRITGLKFGPSNPATTIRSSLIQAAFSTPSVVGICWKASPVVSGDPEGTVPALGSAVADCAGGVIPGDLLLDPGAVGDAPTAGAPDGEAVAEHVPTSATRTRTRPARKTVLIDASYRL